jgi:hypothetical protein
MDNFLDDSLYLGVELGLLLGITEKNCGKTPASGNMLGYKPRNYS